MTQPQANSFYDGKPEMRVIEVPSATKETFSTALSDPTY